MKTTSSARVCWALLLALICSACGTDEDRQPQATPTSPTADIPSPATAELLADVEAIRADLAAFERVDGQWRTEDSASRFGAYFDQAKLKFIDEYRDLGESGSELSQYYFDERLNLFHVYQNKTLKTPREDGNTFTQKIEISMFFDEQGNLLDSRKTVNGRRTQVEEDEIPEVMGQAERLLAAAADAIVSAEKE